MAFINKGAVFLIALQTALHITNGFPSNPILTSKSVEMPAACRDKTYCFDSDNYPTDVVQHLLKTNPLNLTVVSTAPEIHHRIEDDDDDKYEDTGCKKNFHSSPIYFILDDNNEVRVVVQSEDTFIQIIQVQECIYDKPQHGPSDVFSMGELEQLNLRCENLIFNYSFYVLSKDFSSIELVQNKGGLPVDCVCRA